MNSDQKHTRFLRDKLLDGLKKNIDGITINGNMEHRLPNNLNVSFSGVDGDSLLINIDDVAVSNGAACSSSEKAPSYVLRSIGIEEKLANASIRFGVGRDNTLDEINYTIKKLKQVVEDLRSIEELKSEMSLS